MMKKNKNGYVMALDEGTTSSRAIIFDAAGNIVSKAQYPFKQLFPQPGWVEHDPMEILSVQLKAMLECFEKSGLSPGDIAAVGVTNQRETAVVWEKDTGRPVYNAIVWQCRRTAGECDRLISEGMAPYIRQKTGLVIDAYFTGTKYKWILDNVPGARTRAQRGELICGTIETWLIWNLTGGTHVTDYSNASRTMLFDINKLDWDESLCRSLGVPLGMLPRPVPNSMEYGRITNNINEISDLAGIPIAGAAGDQQAALFGHACFSPGMIKNTYGTGCFTLMNTGSSPVIKGGELLASVGWQLNNNATIYVLEGSVFNSGSAIQWIRDELGIIKTSQECDVLAESVPDNGGVYMVPAFTGLGAPYWDMYARGAILGLTRGCTRAHLARAVLESIAYQVNDLLGAMSRIVPSNDENAIKELRADGGAAVSNFLMQFQSDITRLPVKRPRSAEITALGAAYLAGLNAGVWSDTQEIEILRQEDESFEPKMDFTRSESLRSDWRKAVERSLGWAQ